MVLDQKDGVTTRTEDIVIDNSDHLPTNVDLSWTTSTTTKPSSVWTGTQMWEGFHNKDKDFASRIIAGEHHDVVVPPKKIVDVTKKIVKVVSEVTADEDIGNEVHVDDAPKLGF